MSAESNGRDRGMVGARGSVRRLRGAIGQQRGVLESITAFHSRIR